MSRRLLAVFMILAVSLIISGCSKERDVTGTTSTVSDVNKGSIQIKGSDTMVNLCGAWAEAFNAKYPDIDVSVTGGGSGTGIAALINGSTDIASSSRQISDKEMESATKSGRHPQEFVVAKDGVTFIVNKQNPISKLTVKQLADIYTCKITDWKQVGGKPGKIVVLSRDKSSGTHVFVLEHVLRGGNAKGKEQYGADVLMQPSSQSIADEVATNPDAIGYVGIGYVNPAKHKALAIAKDASSKYVEPTPDNIINGTYPIARPLYLYTPDKPSDEVKTFIDFVLSDEGQKIVEKEEFVRIK